MTPVNQQTYIHELIAAKEIRLVGCLKDCGCSAAFGRESGDVSEEKDPKQKTKARDVR